MKIDKNYINNLEHTEAGKLKAVPGGKFIEALGATHGTEQVKKAVSWIFSASIPISYGKGMKAFQTRLLDSQMTGGTLSGADQKYLASIVHGVAIGRFIPDAGSGSNSPIKSA